jgi:carboxyl-terminal processing protease
MRRGLQFQFRSRCLCLLSVFLLLPSTFYPLPSHADSLVSTETREGRLAVFDDVWETIRDRYYDPSFNGLDWEAERERFRPLAAEAKTSAEFYAILRRMVAGLRDAHTRVYAPEEKFDWQHPRVITTGISLREVAGLPAVVAVERGSDAERAGVRVGDIITGVDEVPALELFAKRLRDAPIASTPQSARVRAMAQLLSGPADTTVKVSWRGSDNQERTSLMRRTWRDRTAKLFIEKTRGDIFVVRFDAFTRAVAVELLRALPNRLRGARGLVLDLRGNGGGDSEAMTDVASAFLPTRTKLGRFTDRTGQVTVEPQTRNAMTLAAETITSFDGPVVILTSEATASAAEIFVASVKEMRRATLIGTATCGCVLAIRRTHTLPDGGELNVSEMDYRTTMGVRLEGAGVAPDESVVPDLSDLRTRRDRARERALELLRLKSGK